MPGSQDFTAVQLAPDSIEHLTLLDEALLSQTKPELDDAAPLFPKTTTSRLQKAVMHDYVAASDEHFDGSDSQVDGFEENSVNATPKTTEAPAKQAQTTLDNIFAEADMYHGSLYSDPEDLLDEKGNKTSNQEESLVVASEATKPKMQSSTWEQPVLPQRE